MFTKERGIAVLCGFAVFMAGLYLFAIMASEVNVTSLITMMGFSILALYLTSVIAQNLIYDPPTAKNSENVIPLNNHFENQKHSEDMSNLMLRQRAFIHDIAGPVSIAQGMIEMAMKSIEENPQSSAQAAVKLEKALNSISKISKKVQENRDYLIMSAS